MNIWQLPPSPEARLYAQMRWLNLQKCSCHQFSNYLPKTLLLITESKGPINKLVSHKHLQKRHCSTRSKLVREISFLHDFFLWCACELSTDVYKNHLLDWLHIIEMNPLVLPLLIKQNSIFEVLPTFFNISLPFMQFLPVRFTIMFCTLHFSEWGCVLWTWL